MAKISSSHGAIQLSDATKRREPRSNIMGRRDISMEWRAQVLVTTRQQTPGVMVSYPFFLIDLAYSQPFSLSEGLIVFSAQK
jgi:hypothetical protein